MLEFLTHLFDTSDFPARWQCGNWTTGHGWLHILADLGVWSAYVAIPCVLGFFLLRRKDLPFRFMFVLFAAFILSCGATHLMEAVLFWWPAYRLAGLIKLFTALVSWGTVLALVPVTPRALAMRSPEELEREVAQRQRAEISLQAAYADLEGRVRQRTADLASANAALRAEVEERTRVEEALQHEIEERRRAEEQLRQAHGELETKVRQRTAELTDANQRLRQEVAERVQAVEALKGSEAMFQGLFHFAPDAIVVTDLDGRIQQANLQAEKVFGYARDELIGRPIELLVPLRFHPSHVRHREEYAASPRTRPMGEGRDLLARRKDGSEFPVDVLLAPLQTPGGTLVLSNVHDISHRKANEDIIKTRARQQTAIAEFGQRALESADLGTLLGEAVGLVTRTLNVDLCRVLELLPNGRRFLLRAGRGWGEAFARRAAADAIEDSLAEYALRMGQPFVLADRRTETLFSPSTPLAEHGVVSAISAVIRGQGGPYGELGALATAPRRFTVEDVIFVQAVANLLATSIERNRAEKRVQDSLAEKQVLLREIHHRVKNNLQVISSLLDLQSHHTADATAVEMFRESQNRVRSMALVHERLYHTHDLARINFTDYIEGLADRLFASYRVDADAVRLDLSADAAIDLPIDTAVPCGLLVNELISNCLKHAFPGRAAGVIRVGLVSLGGDGLQLSVADDGVGLPAGADPATAETFGLQLVAMLVGQLRGTLTIERDGGTAFRVAFPVPRSDSWRG